MTFRGSFSPSTDTRPPPNGAAFNLLANSSEEASIFASLTPTNCSVAWATDRVHTGKHSMKMTITSTGAWSVQIPLPNTYGGPCHVVCWFQHDAPGTITTNFRTTATDVGAGKTYQADYTVPVPGSTWVRHMCPVSSDAPTLDSITVGGQGPSGRIYWLDTFYIYTVASPPITQPVLDWRPHPAETFYVKGDFWSCVGATASFAGKSYSAGDLITATGTPNAFGFIYLDDVIWNKTAYVPSPDGPIAQLLQQRPTDNVGVPV